MFSSVIRLGDLDYIAPSQACIKPMLEKEREDAEKKRLRDSGDGRVLLRGDREREELEAEKALKQQQASKIKISLADCLACSGCVTTAEEVLIEQQQPSEVTSAVERIRQELDSNTKLVASISPQSVASLCVYFSDASPAVTFNRLRYFLVENVGMHFVVSTTWAQAVAVKEVVAEFNHRKATNGPLPLLVSSCPGFVCYVEKSHPNLLPYLSNVKSPQAILASIVARYVFPKNNVHHVSIQPCFDRKLEASREEFSSETHCVLSTLEIIEWVASMGVEWSALPAEDRLDGSMHPNVLRLGDDLQELFYHPDSNMTSGGYHQAVLLDSFSKGASKGAKPQVHYATKRNPNHAEVSLVADEKTSGGSTTTNTIALPRVSIMYGFQHIQNLARTMKKKIRTAPLPDFIEIMACPSGCTNGGAQARRSKPEDGDDPNPARRAVEDNAALVQKVNATYDVYLRMEQEIAQHHQTEGDSAVSVDDVRSALRANETDAFTTTFTDRAAAFAALMATGPGKGGGDSGTDLLDDDNAARRLHALKW